MANTYNGSITTIRLDDGGPTVYGPFLEGELGSVGGNVLDVAVTPSKRYAFVSNFGDRTVFRINITNPTNPFLVDNVTLDFFVEDIAVAPNGRFAVVTDGGFSQHYAVINLDNFSLSVSDNLTISNAEAVAISPDSRTVAFISYFGDNLTYGLIDRNTGLTTENVVSTGVGTKPVNLEISPDGQTLITVNTGDNSTSIFRITSPGVVVPGVTPKVTGLQGIPQSVVFSPSGNRAYIFSTYRDASITYRHVNILNILGPGQAVLDPQFSTSPGGGTSQLFGVDTIAVYPAGDRVIFTNSSQNGATDNATVVNLSTMGTSEIVTNLLHTGVATYDDTPPVQVSVPTMNEWGGIIFISVIGFISFRKIRRI